MTVRAGLPRRTTGMMQHIADDEGRVAVCDSGLVLVNVRPAYDVPYGHRCQRPACRDLWPR